jgi:hypothetical protein
MAYENTIGILIAAKDEASAVIASVSTKAKLAADATNANLKNVSKGLEETGSILTRAVTIPALAIGAISADLAYKFNNAMELLHTSAGIPQEAIAGLSQKVLDLAGTTGQAPEKLAQGLYHVASAGNGIWNTSQQLDILKTAADGANLGLANLDDTTYALTSAMASGVKGASDPKGMMGVLSAIVGAGDMKMNDLNGALSTGILSSAASMGVSIQSVGSALATLTDNGEHADEAATRLRMTMALMSSPSSMASKQLEALGLTAENAKKSTEGMNSVFAKSGLTTTKLADDLRKPNGIAVAVEDLKSHLEAAGLSASESDAMLAKAFGGGRTDAALLTLLQNTDRMDSKFKTINDDSSKMGQKLTDLNNTPNQKLRDAWSSIQASLIRVGDDLLPLAAKGMATVSKWVADVAKWWGSLDGSQKKTIEWLITALAIGGPVLKATGGLIKDVQAIGGLFTSLIKLAAPAFAFLAEQFGLLVTTVIPKVVGAISGLFAKVAAGGVMGGIVTAGAMADIALVAEAVAAVQRSINALNGLKGAKANAQSNAQSTLDNATTEYRAGKISKSQYDKISSIGNSAMKDANSADTSFWGNLGKAWNDPLSFSTGGFTGMGGVTDVAGIVHKGEYVVPQSGVDQRTGMPKSMGRGVSIEGGLHIHNQMDEQKFLAKLGWRLAIA